MKDKLLIGAVAIIGVLTLFNTYSILNNDSSSATKSKVAANRVERANDNLDKNTKQNNPTFDPISEQEKNKPAGPKTTLAFAEMEHDFGNIAQGSTNEYIFKFKNTGNEPLIISNAKGSCGCTVPKWPKEPVAPGESGEIQIVYKPGKQKNQQTKSITVTANTEPDNTILKIKANVIEDQATE
jgi:hypothetical protein